MAYSFVTASSQSLSASEVATSLPISMCAWVRPSAGAAGVVCQENTAGTSNLIVLGLNVNRQPFCNVVNNGANNTVSSALAVASNVWSHVGVVLANTTSRVLYTNGASSSHSVSFTMPTGGLNGTRIGARILASIGNFFNGQIADVGIWSAALTGGDVASLARGVSCRLVRPQSLVFYAPLVRDLVDVRGGLTITNNNTATVADHPRIYA